MNFAPKNLNSNYLANVNMLGKPTKQLKDNPQYPI